MDPRQDQAHDLQVTPFSRARFLGEEVQELAFEKSLLNYAITRGQDLEGRYESYRDWVNARRGAGVWPYHRVMMSPVSPEIEMGNEYGQVQRTWLNFGSQDYLGLAQDPRTFEAAKAAIDECGVHSAGSPALGGRTQALLELEQQLAKVLGKEACTVFATGWMAGFGAVSGLARKEDTIVMDCLVHNCLQEGAWHATQAVRKFRHNDIEDLTAILEEERGKNSKNGVFVVIESLYSMDSDSPDLAAMIRLAQNYEAIVILDVAHDFGSMGEEGLGLLEILPRGVEPDIILGSFSKTFAANGGFVASTRKVKDYLGIYSAPFVFSNAISPLQAKVAAETARIVFSAEGDILRKRLMDNILLLRNSMEENGLEVGGDPSPIVPVFVGDEKLARLTSRYQESYALRANLVEFPAVPRGKARFRFQVMARHDPASILRASSLMALSRQEAAQAWATFSKCS
jgi:7-keto-8-aminopelargonate synthetase-like enzyme